MEDISFESKILHTPYVKKDSYNSLAMPVYNTAAYEFDTAEEMEKAFCGQSPEHAYSRITNPTVEYFERRVQSITGALSVTALNSGMAAITNILMTIGGTGKNIVTSPHLFGNTFSLLKSTLKDFGLEARFVDLTNPEAVEAAIDKNTCALFLETITNPQLEVADLGALSTICKNHGIPLVADTTVVPFNAFKATSFGIDIEIVSSTKYISGGATTIGGLIMDYGTYDWSRSEKLAPFYKQVGKAAFTMKLRREIHRNLGSYMTPQVAYMQTLGLETMEIRYERQAKSCLELAKQLQQIDRIESVNYTALPENPFYEVSKKQFGEYAGAMFTINLSNKEACFTFLNRLQLIKRATNLFDNKTLAIHPASTIYGNFTAQQRVEMNVSDKTIRISIGLERVSDLYQDILQAL